MSTDSTELTFIRCPSCRSLVPAVSPRCRMCGATLEAGKADGAKGSDDVASSPRSSGRVRQQTVAVSSSEVDAAKEVYGGAPNRNRSVVSEEVDLMDPERQDTLLAQDEPVLSDEGAGYVDPLGAFIQEVPVEEAPALTSSSAPVNGNGYQSHEEVDDEVGHIPEARPTKTEEPPVRETKPVEAPPKAPPIEQRPRVIIESGQKRPAGQKSGLSFGKTRNETLANEPAPEPKTERHSFSDPAPRVNSSREREDRQNRERDVPANPIAREVAPTERLAEEAAPKPAPQPTKSAAIASSGPKPTAEATKGKLYGWLVSYSDPRGLATELRDGKFFISRSSLKGTDLILEDDSISTPHALMGVNVNDGLIIQDLMSDRGVFVRRRTGDTYQRVLESTKLEHGDWVRFGDIEFLVAIVSGAAAAR